MVMDKIEKISKIKKAAQQVPVTAGEELQRLAPNKEHFDKLMVDNSRKVTAETQIEATTKGASPIEVQQSTANTISTKKVTPAELLTQTQETVKRFDDPRNKLKTPDIQLKEAATPLLRNKLTNIDEGVRVALSKAGLEYKETFGQETAGNPILRFLGMLTDGQSKL